MIKREDELFHKKRFGQYFSGSRVAELLVSLLPENIRITSVVDPMAGKGDLLQAAKSLFHDCRTILGVEIDKEVAKRCRQQVPEARIINGDAFCCKELVSRKGWDLVITNPPYVRYQLQADDNTQMPSRESIKKNLIRQITSLKHLEDQDRELLVRLAQGYSGLSDMAVPSWILCAALVREGGCLAMVVPDTWLNREYAGPIQYLLLKCFDILVIARDVNAVWFDDALVKTCLVVARRKKTVMLEQVKECHTHVLNINSELADSRSLIGNLFYEEQQGFHALKKVLAADENYIGQGYSVEIKKEMELFPFMLSGTGKQSWIMAEDQRESLTRRNLPEELKRLAGEDSRTYVPDRYLIKGVQNRGEIAGICVDPGNIKRAILSVKDEIRSCDLAACSLACRDSYGVMDRAVEEYITAAESHTNSRGLHFKEYSAVSPNEKKDDAGYRRFWYMLPVFTRRHLPDLCMNRVCSSVCECIYVPQSEEVPIAIDANFVTMWGEEQKKVFICLALLNSTWSRCYLELVGTVMGGGALKVEAGHVKRLLVPRYSEDQAHRLENCGRQIVSSSAVSSALLNEIDRIVFEPFKRGEEIRLEMTYLMEQKLRERGVNK